MKKEELIRLYELYGFRKEEEVKGVLVFIYHTGFFRNAEIVLLRDNETTREEAEKIAEDYRNIGYQNINMSYYGDLQDAQKKLFYAFFNLEESKRRLRMEYDDFCRKQNEKLLNEYVYIPCRYRSENEESCCGLVEHVVRSAEMMTGRLTILEAAAGYGKTCTVYEILRLLLERTPDKIPMFIELSKNRAARIFRYVLQDEKNKKFPILSYELVLNEIKNGNIPLIIDGFDELIEQKASDEDIDEQSLTMLATIAELLESESKAWILLTTRSSAMFTGDIFEEWVLSKLGADCSVERMQILAPYIKDWIGPEKYNIVYTKESRVEKISNPVLLAFIRGLSVEELKELLRDGDAILEKYFELLLPREVERQSLELTERELYEVMEKLAADFARYDMTAEAVDFIRELLDDILEEDLLKYRNRYKEKEGTDEGMLTREEFVKRISHNNFLDRVSMKSNQIGFINEFILGILTGDAVKDGYLNPQDLSERFIDISVTAYETRKYGVREAFYGKLKERLLQVSLMCRLNAEKCLLNTINSNYEKGYFKSVYIRNSFSFDSEYQFLGCTFDSCIFDNCTIFVKAFEGCSFFNCQFYDIQVVGNPKPNLVFMGGKGYEPLLFNKNQEQDVPEDIDKYEKIVLEQFWKPGYQTAELRRTYTALFKGTSSNDNTNIQNAVKSLIKKELLKELNVCYELNTSQLDEIKRILGRQ